MKFKQTCEEHLFTEVFPKNMFPLLKAKKKT